MFGLSTRKCGYPLPVRRGTSPVSIASKLTSPSARSGTARTPLQFYLLELSHFSRRRTASITLRSQRSRFAGSRLIQNIWRPYLAWQLHRSVSCSGAIGDFASFHRRSDRGPRSAFAIFLRLGGTLSRKSQPTAGGSV